MEDLEKYIFDPANPTGFKAYKLLLKIIKDRQNIVYLDYYFFLEIFSKEIFDNEMINEVWDKPDNFDELSSIGKATIYMKNYSKNDFKDVITKRLSKINNKPFKSLFKYFSTNEIELSQSTKIIDKKNFKLYDYYYHEDISTDFVDKLLTIFSISDDSMIDVEQDFNYLFFVRKNYINILSKFAFSKTTLIITTLDDYENADSKLKNNNLIKPILLKKFGDIHQLIDYLTFDKNKSQISINQPINYLSKIEIKNYFSLEIIKLDKLKDKKEIYILGENGDGKTILLQAILLALKGNQNEGEVINFIKQNPHKDLILKGLDNQKNEFEYKANPQEQKSSFDNVFGYGISRFRNDSDQKDTTGYLSLFNHNQALENPIKWLQHLDYKEAKGDETGISLSLAKTMLKEILEENVEMEVSPDEVIFIERGTKVKFEQLSDGYKSVIIWLADLISRLAEKQPQAIALEEFKGIVLVDEIGVFLHPKWQYQIVRKLRRWLPNIQFIFTTHSPMVLMGASSDAVFYKLYKEKGITKISEQIPYKVIENLMANGIITAPFLFGLESAALAASQAEPDTDDDYLSSKIHQAISKRLQENNQMNEEEILNLIQEELLKFEQSNPQ
jgi:predicted ATPase